MTRIGFALAMAALVGSAAWAYHVNHQTAEAQRRVAALEAALAAERERIQVLSVDWARLNAPERLHRLVARHNDALGLMPMAPDHFGEVAGVPYPPPPPLVASPGPDAGAGAGAGAGPAGHETVVATATVTATATAAATAPMAEGLALAGGRE